MNQFLTILLIAITLVSCGFNSSDDDSGGGSIGEVKALDQGKDLDGDMVVNEREITLGRNPYVADLPEFKMRFLQNYEIKVSYQNLETEEKNSFSINTNIHEDRPDYRYRIGNIFIRNESFKNAASIGKFSSHSWGEVKKKDLSWISYPDLDPRFYSDIQLKYKKFFNEEKYKILDIKVFLKNSLQLKENRGFNAITNPVISFYFYDYEKESYELVESVKVNRHFNAGVNEAFDIEISNIPVSLLERNYFKKGEFIISELTDFEIPDMKTTYKKLLASVRSKSIPVIYNTPLESSVKYVGLREEKSRFSNILEALYDKKFEIKDNKLEKINQFRSNLKSFTYLKEVKNLDKNGKWFVFTNKLNRHYLDHKFKTNDLISLSYITGSTLASQTSDEILSFGKEVTSSEGGELYTLGQISPNSKIEFQIKGLRSWGEERTFMRDRAESSGGSCGRNCSSWEYRCDIEINLFNEFNRTLLFNKNIESEELKKLKLVINNVEYSLDALFKEKKIDLFWIDENLHVRINDVSQIKDIVESEENILSLKLYKFKDTTFNGVKLTHVSGRQGAICPSMVMNLAGSNGWYLSVDSLHFGRWQNQVDWSKVKRGEAKNYSKDFSLDISSNITNLYN